MNEISSHDRCIILNGTLCNARLWKNFEDSVLANQSSERNCFSKNSFLYPDMTSGQSIASMARKFGNMLSHNVRTWVLGYSLGGIVALELARHYQSKIAGLVLVCSNADGQTEEKEAAVKKQLEYVNAHGLEAVFDDILLPAYFGAARSKHEEEAQRIKRSGVNLGEVVLRNQLKTLRTRIDQNANLASINLPVLLVCGETDVLCTPQQNKTMHTQLPRSVLHQCENVGHALPLLRSEELAKQMLLFVAQVSGGEF